VVRARNGMQIHAGSNNMIENNIFVNCLRNIVFMDSISTQLYWNDMKGFMVGNWIARNIFYQVAPPEELGLARGAGTLSAGPVQVSSIFRLFPGWTEDAVAQSDNNLFFQGTNGAYALQDTRKVDPSARISSFEQWQKLGYDAHSLRSDPLFIDANQDDYRLKPESPALQIGFQQIDAAAFGPRKAREEKLVR
jgi:hypothetical protein